MTTIQNNILANQTPVILDQINKNSISQNLLNPTNNTAGSIPVASNYSEVTIEDDTVEDPVLNGTIVETDQTLLNTTRVNIISQTESNDTITQPSERKAQHLIII